MVLNKGARGSFPVNNTAETIFERLESAGLTWRVYVEPHQVVSATGLIHASRLAPFFATHFRSATEFYEDARKGQLPAYSFIEPCLVPPHTDMHPPGLARLRRFLHLPSPSSLKWGDHLLGRIYDAVRTSATPDGSNWKNTLLLVTFDEHGGTYDHVPPPKVPPPDLAAPTGEMGFKFDRSGVRVPTLAISAWIEPKTVVHGEFRATSVIRTLRERWSLGPPLSQRDAAAADIAPILTRETPRSSSDWPIVSPQPIHPRAAKLFHILDSWNPLTPLGRDLFEAALAWEVHKTGTPTSIQVGSVGKWRVLRHARRLKHAAFPRVTGSR